MMFAPVHPHKALVPTTISILFLILITFLQVASLKAYPDIAKLSFFRRSQSSTKWTGSETDLHKSTLEAEKYSSLPHTIFSPDGRLHNIEKTARLASDPKEATSSLIVALKFGSACDESIIILSISHMSPHLYIKPTSVDKEDAASSDEKNDEDSSYYAPLWSHLSHADNGNELNRNQVSMPLSILPSNLIIGTGGPAADAMALHRKIRQMGLNLYKENDNMQSTHRIQGTVLSSMLAKKIATSLQLPTQSSSSNRMLASSAIVVGPDGFHASRSGIRHAIWRCDPTGQFWNCHAAAAGRGAGSAEGTVMKAVFQQVTGDERKEKDREIELDELRSKISSRDVREYLSGLSFDDAVVLGCKSIAKALGLSNDDDVFHRIGLQGILLKGQSRSYSRRNHEIIHPEILRSALKRSFEG